VALVIVVAALSNVKRDAVVRAAQRSALDDALAYRVTLNNGRVSAGQAQARLAVVRGATDNF
jgi:hypothetical protein